MYYCFSSGKGGDIFTFVQEMEGLDFKGALRVLAERAGVELTTNVREDRDAKDRLFALMEAATHIGEQELAKTKVANEYLTARGISVETIKRWRLGYTKPEWRHLYTALAKLGYSRKECEEAGLIKKSEKGSDYYDRFRGRIMFPIKDSAGRVIAFSARILPDANNKEFTEETAKYINSPDTPLYNKSYVLYGYDKAKLAIRKFDFSIVVEGQMDVIMSHQAGYGNTVAVSGTAMTETQLKLLDRLSHNIVLAFDADQAGVASSGRTAELALSMGMNVKVAALPPGVDPADLVKTGALEWKQIVRGSKHIVDFYLDYLFETVRDARTLRLEVGRRVLPYIALIPNRIDQAHFVSMVAGRLGLGEEPVWEELKKVPIETTEKSAPKRPVQARTFHNLTERRLVGILLSQRQSQGRDLDVDLFEGKLLELFGEETLAKLIAAGNADQNQLLFEVESVYEDAHTLQRDVDEMLLNVKRQHIIEDREQVLTELRQAEHDKNATRIAKLAKRYATLTKDLEALGV
ncbi:MAG TPA: DNA primase, partial [Candidatus Paceibacterota bacterium]